jgi:competence protein ComEC
MEFRRPVRADRPPPSTSSSSVGWVDEALVVTIAAATWLGAGLAPSPMRPLPALAVAGLALLAGVRLRAAATMGVRPLPFVAVAVAVGLGSFGVGAHRGVRADDAHRPLPEGPLAGSAIVIGDPEPIGLAGWAVELRVPPSHRIEAAAFGRAGAVLGRAPVGATVEVSGRLRPTGDRPWLRTRHIVARATIDEAAIVARPGWFHRFTGTVRDRIGAGADAFGPRPRALYRGLVLGDDRFQAPGQTLRFRLVGLSHLLAVSGQNVAFVLAVASPVLRRLEPRVRLVALGAVLVVFAVITRLEPSVLRAVTTAGISAWAASTGRARSGLGVLGVAVTGLIWIDPFLVDAVGFQLSVAASAGILVVGPAVAGRFPGPSWLVVPLATSLAAQAGVAPVLHHHFGPVPLAAVPANVVAGWAAALVMTWGMSVGVVAGLLPPAVAAVVQWPAGVALWWLEAVAALGARLPGPRPGLVVMAGLGLLAVLARASTTRWAAPVVALVAVAAVTASVPRPPTTPAACGPGIAWYPADVGGASVLVVDGEAGMGAVEDCRLAGVRSAGVVVAVVGDRRAGRTVAALREVVAVGRVVAPPRHAVVGASRVLEPATIATAGGRLELRPDPAGARLAVRFEPGDRLSRPRRRLRADGRGGPGPHR